ncbi:MAG: type I methionyl aminopeptidase [Oscillospiraceae bacterium]|jgi:methionyl aminopeptidase|nr:type I methionyl aminopeptidase [Oscillospiraceae bacterium]
MIPVKSAREIDTMRRACRVTALALKAGSEAIAPGVTTGAICGIIRSAIECRGATPTFLGYRGYPAPATISVNEELIHGIPGSRRLRAGDIVSIDVGAAVDGYTGDCAGTYPVGEVSQKALLLIRAAEESFFEGIRHAREGAHLYDISKAIQLCAERRGYSVVRAFTGHGVGRQLHEEPEVPNFCPVKGRGPRLLTGMTLAVEPMLACGSAEVVIKEDGWTVCTADGELCAHYEHTVLVTADGPELLTIAEGCG